MKNTVIFLDDDGVMSGNAGRAPQWQKLVGEYMVPRFGGTPEARAAANRKVHQNQLNRYARETHGHPDFDYNSYLRRGQLRWLTAMFEEVGMVPPPNAARLEIARAVQPWVCERVHCPLSGVPRAVRELGNLGYWLYAAFGREIRRPPGVSASHGNRGMLHQMLGTRPDQPPEGGTTGLCPQLLSLLPSLLRDGRPAQSDDAT
jgi:hypothetical protein